MIVSEDNVKLLLGLSSAITAEEQSFISLVHAKAEGLVRDYLHYDPEQKQHTEYLPRHMQAGGPGHSDLTEIPYVTGSHAYFRTNYGELTLQLTHLPIRTVISVHVDSGARHGTASGAFGDDMLWALGTDYWVDWDWIDSNDNGVSHDAQLKSYGGWPSEPGTVRVIYRAGYSPAEFDGIALADAESGPMITSAGVDGSAIALAVHDTITNMFLAMQATKKKAFGFTPGPLTSEKAQDYSYTIGNTAMAAAIAGMALSDKAKQMLEPKRHYGVGRL